MEIKKKTTNTQIKQIVIKVNRSKQQPLYYRRETNCFKIMPWK